MRKAYLAIKFHEDNKNKELIESLSDSLKKSNLDTTIMARDYEKWGKVKFGAKELMDLTFKLIDNNELLIIEFSEKGVGLGIEAGYAFAKGKPIIVIAKTNSEMSNTLRGLTNNIIFYDNPKDLTEKIKKSLINLFD